MATMAELRITSATSLGPPNKGGRGGKGGKGFARMASHTSSLTPGSKGSHAVPSSRSQLTPATPVSLKSAVAASAASVSLSEDRGRRASAALSRKSSPSSPAPATLINSSFDVLAGRALSSVSSFNRLPGSAGRGRGRGRGTPPQQALQAALRPQPSQPLPQAPASRTRTKLIDIVGAPPASPSVSPALDPPVEGPTREEEKASTAPPRQAHRFSDSVAPASPKLVANVPRIASHSTTCSSVGGPPLNVEKEKCNSVLVKEAQSQNQAGMRALLTGQPPEDATVLAPRRFLSNLSRISSPHSHAHSSPLRRAPSGFVLSPPVVPASAGERAPSPLRPLDSVGRLSPCPRVSEAPGMDELTTPHNSTTQNSMHNSQMSPKDAPREDAGSPWADLVKPPFAQDLRALSATLENEVSQTAAQEGDAGGPLVLDPARDNGGGQARPHSALSSPRRLESAAYSPKESPSEVKIGSPLEGVTSLPEASATIAIGDGLAHSSDRGGELIPVSPAMKSDAALHHGGVQPPPSSPVLPAHRERKAAAALVAEAPAAGADPEVEALPEAAPAPAAKCKSAEALWEDFVGRLEKEGVAIDEIRTATDEQLMTLLEGPLAFAFLERLKLKTLWHERVTCAAPPRSPSPPQATPTPPAMPAVSQGTAPNPPWPGTPPVGMEGASVAGMLDLEVAGGGAVDPVPEGHDVYAAVREVVLNTATSKNPLVVSSIAQVSAGHTPTEMYDAQGASLRHDQQNPKVLYYLNASEVALGDVATHGFRKEFTRQSGVLAFSTQVPADGSCRHLLCEVLVGRCLKLFAPPSPEQLRHFQRDSTIDAVSHDYTYSNRAHEADVATTYYVFQQNRVLPRYAVTTESRGGGAGHAASPAGAAAGAALGDAGEHAALMCRYHPEEELRLYCHTDKELTCALCASIGRHSQKHCVSLVELIKSLRGQFASNERAVAKRLGEVDLASARLKTQQNSVEETVARSRGALQARISAIRQEVDAFERMILEKLRRREEATAAAVAQSLRRADAQAASLAKAQTCLRSLLGDGLSERGISLKAADIIALCRLLEVDDPPPDTCDAAVAELADFADSNIAKLRLADDAGL